MPGPWDELKEKLSALTSGWASYAALGTFLLYLFGYLSLRFHLTALGIPTDLAVIDSRYLYAGAKFVVYILPYIPSIVLIGIVLIIVLAPPVLLVSGMAALVKRWRTRAEVNETEATRVGVFQRIRGWSEKPWLVASFGILMSEGWIRLMRECFLINNALLNPTVTDQTWVGRLMKDETHKSLYFVIIVGGTALVGWLLGRAWRLRQELATARLLKGQEANDGGTLLLITLLLILFTIQLLLLPINHGVLVADKVLPRVKDLGGQEKLHEKQTAWLVWEGTDGVTYLVQEERSSNTSESNLEKVRTLVTLPKKDLKRTEVVANDPIEKLLNESVLVSP
jgi:hypothetical protein